MSMNVREPSANEEGKACQITKVAAAQLELSARVGDQKETRNIPDWNACLDGIVDPSSGLWPRDRVAVDMLSTAMLVTAV